MLVVHSTTLKREKEGTFMHSVYPEGNGRLQTLLEAGVEGSRLLYIALQESGGLHACKHGVYTWAPPEQ